MRYGCTCASWGSPAGERTGRWNSSPGNAISGEALFQSKTSNEYIPTGTRLEYHFDIRTVDGEQFETEPETLVYLNTGLDWDVKSSGLINVYYYQYDQLSEVRAEAVLMVADETYQHMGPILGVELTEPMSIVVYSNYDHMREALRPSSQVAARHLRTLGQAFSDERTLLVDGSSDPFVGDNTLTTTAHEFTHLLVADAAGSAYSQVHLWLNEGLAVYSERQPNNEYERYMEFAIENDRVPPLAGLRTFSGTPQETLQAYGQGHAVASYMLENYDQSLMADPLRHHPNHAQFRESADRRIRRHCPRSGQRMARERGADAARPIDSTAAAAASPAHPPANAHDSAGDGTGAGRIAARFDAPANADCGAGTYLHAQAIPNAIGAGPAIRRWLRSRAGAVRQHPNTVGIPGAADRAGGFGSVGGSPAPEGQGRMIIRPYNDKRLFALSYHKRRNVHARSLV